MSGFEPPAPARQRTRIRRTLVAFTTVIALGMLPMMTVASDVFRDLDDTHPFHDAANEMYTARITRGCATNPRRSVPTTQ